MFSFEDQICLVTGTGNPEGIGFGCAKVLGELGGTILLTATTERIRERRKELEKSGISRVESFVADLCDRQQVEKLVLEIREKYGRIDVLINNAGNASVSERKQGAIRYPLEEMNYESWDKIILRNLTLNYNVTSNVLKLMREQQYGRIVHISSVTGPLVTHTGQAGYGAAKAGITALSKSIAYEEAGNGILSNCILPGWIKTGVLNEAQMEAACKNPLKRPGTAREVGYLAAFLASRENSYINGQDIVIDGGSGIQEIVK
ncbi:MAG: SDR family NAD(P)-dependent oxidoreductase [Lachnospiraceae bacterium]